MEYIPGDRALVPLKAGEAAPADGWFVPPALMQELVPLLERRFEGGDVEGGAKPQAGG